MAEYTQTYQTQEKININFLHMRALISGRFFTIPGKSALKTFAQTHFPIVNFAIESDFDVNWTLGMLKDA